MRSFRLGRVEWSGLVSEGKTSFSLMVKDEPPEIGGRVCLYCPDGEVCLEAKVTALKTTISGYSHYDITAEVIEDCS